MKEICGTLNAVVCGALLPATVRGNTIAVTADPAMLVPGVAGMSTVAGMPSIAVASANSAVPPPAGWTLYLIVPGAALTKDETLNGGTFAHVGAAGTVPPDGYIR